MQGIQGENKGSVHGFLFYTENSEISRIILFLILKVFLIKFLIKFLMKFLIKLAV